MVEREREMNGWMLEMEEQIDDGWVVERERKRGWLDG
jgi:hypothetical protein